VIPNIVYSHPQNTSEIMVYTAPNVVDLNKTGVTVLTPEYFVDYYIHVSNILNVRWT
jgi:hypothetical protein